MLPRCLLGASWVLASTRACCLDAYCQREGNIGRRIRIFPLCVVQHHSNISRLYIYIRLPCVWPSSIRVCASHICTARILRIPFKCSQKICVLALFSIYPHRPDCLIDCCGGAVGCNWWGACGWHVGGVVWWRPGQAAPLLFDNVRRSGSNGSIRSNEVYRGTRRGR